MQVASLASGFEEVTVIDCSIWPAIGIRAFFAASNARPQGTPPLKLSERILITVSRA
jgi:hypothetical protein